MVDWIIILGIHICREEASFQRPEDVSPCESGRDKKLEFTLALTSMRSLAEDNIIGSDSCNPDGQPMKVHKCDGHGKVDWRPCEVNVHESFRTETGRVL